MAEQEKRVVQISGTASGKSKDGPKENETQEEEVNDGQE